MGGHHDHSQPQPQPLHDSYGPEARYAVEREAELPTTKWDGEVARGLELGLPGADSIVDKRIPTICPTSPASTHSSRRPTWRT